MRILGDKSSISVLSSVRQSERRLLDSMSRAASGQKIQKPGDGPTEFGISEMLRYQIRNGREAMGTIQNARNYIATADEWMQGVQDMLVRMRELSIASKDGSKSQADRLNLDMEFQQLKQEISRIARDATYNGVQVAGRDQMLSYDQDQETFVFSNLDGTDKYSLNTKVLSGLEGVNGVDFNFDPSNDYMLSQDGGYIFYADSNNELSRYEIETGILTKDNSNTESKRLDIDEQGRLWYATETSTGSGVYTLEQQNIQSWTQETNTIDTGDIADMASQEFQVYQDRAIYVDTNGDIVSRSLRNFGDVEVELDASELSFSTTAGQFAISEDGLYMADVPSAGTLRVTNIETQRSSTYTFGAGLTISSLEFGVDNQDVAFVDSSAGVVHRLDLEPGDTPILSNDQKIHQATGSNGFMGVSVSGGSHRANIRVQNGPNAAQSSFVTGADMRLYTLGLSRVSVESIESADKALALLQAATDQISVQRARIGSEHSRLEFGHDALVSYVDNVEQVDSFLRDSDLAKESAIIAEQQVRYQASIALLAQASNRTQALLGALQR